MKLTFDAVALVMNVVDDMCAMKGGQKSHFVHQVPECQRRTRVPASNYRRYQSASVDQKLSRPVSRSKIEDLTYI